jgi:hypothetical protein
MPGSPGGKEPQTDNRRLAGRMSEGKSPACRMDARRMVAGLPERRSQDGRRFAGQVFDVPNPCRSALPRGREANGRSDQEGTGIGVSGRGQEGQESGCLRSTRLRLSAERGAVTRSKIRGDARVRRCLKWWPPPTMDRAEKTHGNEAQESIGLKTAATPDSTTDSSDEESLEVEPSNGPSQPSEIAVTRCLGRRNGGKAGVAVTRHGGRRGESSEGPETASRGKGAAVKRRVSGNDSNLRIGGGEEAESRVIGATKSRSSAGRGENRRGRQNGEGGAGRCWTTRIWTRAVYTMEGHLFENPEEDEAAPDAQSLDGVSRERSAMTRIGVATSGLQQESRSHGA